MKYSLIICLLLISCKGAELTLGVRQEPLYDHNLNGYNNQGYDQFLDNQDETGYFGYAELTFQLTPQEVVVIHSSMTAAEAHLQDDIHKILNPKELPITESESTSWQEVALAIVNANPTQILVLSILALVLGLVLIKWRRKGATTS